MSQHEGQAGGQPRRTRTGGLALTAALAGAAVLAAACGGGSHSQGASASASGPPTRQRMVAYATCMRGHGDPGFPDPQRGPGGAWLFPEDPQTRTAFTGPGYNAAQRTCKQLSPPGELTPAQRQAAISQLLRLARCMRARGITNFPDPSIKGGGVGVNLSLSGIDPHSPQFQTAARACHMPSP